MLPEVLTVDQLAKLLECTPETVEERTRERTLPGLKYGRSWVYPREAVLEVLSLQALAHVRPSVPLPPVQREPASRATPVTRVDPARARPVQRTRGRSPAPLPDPPASV